MFKLFKEKIKGALSIFSKKVEELPKEDVDVKEIPPEIKVEVEPKKEKAKLEVKKPKVEEKELVKEVKKIEEIPEKEEPKGFFKKIAEKITTTRISDKDFDDLFWDLELVLLENNVASEVVDKIKEDLKKSLVDKPIPRGKAQQFILDGLKESVSGLFDVSSFDLLECVKKKKPFVVCFFGINGSGKTTSIAKLAYLLKNNGFEIVLAAGDTFRAAAIDQLQIHADNIDVKLIKHDYGSDAAAVAFDAVKHAQLKNKDVVLIDTAGRIHSDRNLLEEMKKIVKIAKPDLKVFVGEAITGNDCVEQAKKFDEIIGIDAIILAKADIDEKGGASLSISYVTKKPILYLGVGQEYKDLELFNKEKIIKSVGL